MALIQETGSGDNLAANTYMLPDDLRTYGKSRGIDLNSKTDEELEVLLVKAMDYLEAQRSKYKGYKASSLQPLEWPRSEVWGVEQVNSLLPDNEIPRLVEYAQMALAIEAMDKDLQPNKSPGQTGKVIKEKIGAIETVYSADAPKQNFVSSLAKPDAMLAPLLKRSGLSMVRS